MRRRVLGLAVAAALAAISGARASAQTQVLIVSGLGGAPQYTKEFGELSERLSDALRSRYGVADSNATWLGEKADAKLHHYAGESTRENIAAALHRMAARARPGDEVVLVLIGHGSGSEADTKISLPGPDLTAADFESLLAPFARERLAVLDLTSASGDALAVFSAPNRVVITATKSAYERNESHFAGYFVDALTKDGADADKDGRVSMLEAFQYATRETERLYADDSRMQTEHAQLDDDGDKQGTGAPTGRSGDGLLARRFFLDAGTSAAVAGNDPRLAALYAQRFALTDSVEALKLQKPKLAASAYETELERLLIALARKAHEIRGIEGQSPKPNSAVTGGGRP